MGSALAMLLVASVPALAGEGNPNYLGVLSSTAPSGYVPSPTCYSPALGQTVLTFQFVVTNLTVEPQSMSLQLSLNHITTYRGVDVSDGQPGVSNGAVVDGQFDEHLATEVQDANPTFTAFSIAANATQTMQMSRTFSAGQSGYFQVDVAKVGLTAQKGLIGFEIRICSTSVVATSPSPVATSPSPIATSPSPVATSPSPVTTSPSPGGGVGAGSPSPSPPGAVLAATGSTPQSALLGLVLLALGALALISGFAWRRRES
jgi:hypothetical protein